MVICACDKQTEASIHNTPTAAASGPDGNNKIFSSEKIFSLISSAQRDCKQGLDVGLELTQVLQLAVKTYTLTLNCT